MDIKSHTILGTHSIYIMSTIVSIHFERTVGGQNPYSSPISLNKLPCIAVVRKGFQL